MECSCLTFRILPGKTGVARQFLLDLNGESRSPFSRACLRLGLSRALWFFGQGAGDDQLILYVESADVSAGFDTLVRSRDPFDQWLKSQLAGATGVDLSDPPEGIRPSELLAAFPVLSGEEEMVGQC